MKFRRLKRSYLEPEEVLAKLFSVAPGAIGDVVMNCPSVKFGEPDIRPVIEPSEFCFQFDKTGTPGGAADFFLGGVTSTLTLLSSLAALPPKRSKRPGRRSR